MKENEMVKNSVLSIDPGSKKLGWALFKDNRYIVSSVINITNKRFTWLQRTDMMVIDVLRLLTKYNVETVVIEEPGIFISTSKGRAASNSGAVLKLTALVHSIRTICKTRKIKVRLISVQKWKGQVPKAITQKRIKRHLDLTIVDDNEADAVGIGLFYLRN